MYKVLNIPREIYQLIDYLNRNGMKTPNLFTLERKHRTNALINDIRDWLNMWSTTDFRKYTQQHIFCNSTLSVNRRLLIFVFNSAFISAKANMIHCFTEYSIIFNLAGNPYTAAEALLMLLESPPEPLASPMEEECLYAENFDKCCEIIKVLSGPKKNTFLYICMFLNETLKYQPQNRLEANKLGESRKDFKLATFSGNEWIYELNKTSSGFGLLNSIHQQ